MAMRTVLLAILLAGAASPAIAAGDGRWDRSDRNDRSERSERSESQGNRDSDSRPQRSERSEPRRVDTPAPQRNFEPRNVETAQPRNIEPRTIDNGARERAFEAHRMGDGENRGRGPRAVEPGSDNSFEARPADVNRVERRAGETVREWRGRDRVRDDSPSTIEERNLRRAPGGGLVEQRRPLPRVLEQRERRVSRTPVFGTEPPAPRTANVFQARPSRNWSTNWRNDRRYDWRDWRRHHRSNFYFGFYNDPFGWDYMRYGIGWRLWPSYYNSSYWLNDPWQYRLPPAYGPYRWVRYHHDALLVNIYTGEVVDVEYDFFW